MGIGEGYRKLLKTYFFVKIQKIFDYLFYFKKLSPLLEIFRIYIYLSITRIEHFNSHLIYAFIFIFLHSFEKIRYNLHLNNFSFNR